VPGPQLQSPHKLAHGKTIPLFDNNTLIIQCSCCAFGRVGIEVTGNGQYIVRKAKHCSDAFSSHHDPYHQTIPVVANIQADAVPFRPNARIHASGSRFHCLDERGVQPGLSRTHDEPVQRNMRANATTQSKLNQVVSADSSAIAAIPESIKQKFREFVEQGHKDVISLYSSNQDDDTIRDLIAWHESPPGKKIYAQMVIRNNDKEALAPFLVEFSKSLNAKQRVELINKLDAITRYSDTTSEWLCDFILATYSALPKRSSGDAGRNEKNASFNGAMKNSKGALVAFMKGGMWTSLLYAYRNLSDDELKACIAFNETAAGRKEADCSYFLLNHMLGGWKDLCRKNPELVSYIYVQGQNNSLPKENGIGQNGGVSAAEFSLALARLGQMRREVQEKNIITRFEIPKEIVDISECDVPPTLATKLQPVYPEIARLAATQGMVYVRVLIDEMGQAVKAEIVKRMPPDCNVFDKGSLNSIMSARYVA
jgi:hypothetical protein